MASPICVLIDGRKIGHGGIGKYIQNLVIGLTSNKSLSNKIKITVITTEKAAKNENWLNNINLIIDKTPLYSLRELITLKKYLFNNKFDLFHSPHYTLPFFLQLPSVVTIHDLIHINHPQKFYYPFIAKPLIKSAVKRASQIITVSNDTKKEILNLFKNNKYILSKIQVIENALDPFFQNATLDVTNNEHQTTTYLLDKFNLTKDSFIFSLFSTDKPHKGLSDLITVFQKTCRLLNEQKNEKINLKLVIAGQGTTFSKIFCQNNNIINLGLISNVDLLHLYKGSLFIAIPSITEGFCFPALEAKSCGAILCARPVGIIPEITNEADFVAKDLSFDSYYSCFKNAVLNMIGDNNAKSLSKQNFQSKLLQENIISKYNYQTMAQKTFDVYLSALTNN